MFENHRTTRSRAAAQNAKETKENAGPLAMRNNGHRHEKHQVIELSKDVKVADSTSRSKKIRQPEIQPQDREYMCTDYSDDVYEYMLSREKLNMMPADFISTGEPTPRHRSILIDWLVQVHQRFSLMQETLHLTIFILDRMLATTPIGKEELQLVGITCMFVASKFEEVFAPDIADYEYLTDNAFNKRQIVRMELNVLRVVGFELSRPNSLSFLRWFSRDITNLLELTDVQIGPVHQQAKYFGELALLDHTMSSVTPSRIAAASIIIALKVRGYETAEVEKLIRKLCNATKLEIMETCKLLAATILRPTYQERLVAIKNKFASSKTQSVSNLSPQQIAIVQSFA